MKHGLGMSRQAISQHMDVLESAGLVITKRDGRYKLHFLDTSPLKVIIERWPLEIERSEAIRIVVTSVYVDDHEKALKFYADILGSVKKTDIAMGEARWLTVVSPEDRDGPELLLEPDGHPAAGPFKRVLVEDGIPTSFGVDDVHAAYERLSSQGVHLTQEPTEMGAVTTPVFDDTCGNLIQVGSQG